MSVIIPSGAADANGILNAILGMFYSQGYSNVSGGTKNQVAISNNYASLIVPKKPAPAPSKSSPSYPTWAATPTPTGSQTVAVFQAYIPGHPGTSGNLPAILGYGSAIALASNGTVSVAINKDNGKVATSADGITWTLANPSLSYSGFTPNDTVVWSGARFVAKAMNTSTFNCNGLFTSTDGVNWSFLAISGASNTTYYEATLATNGAGVVTLIGNGQIAASQDGGVTWSATSYGWAGPPAAVGWIGGAFTMYEPGRSFSAQSTNGAGWSSINWSAPALATLHATKQGAASSTTLCGLGQSTDGLNNTVVARTSNGGATWATTVLPAKLPAMLCYGAGLFVVLACNGSGGTFTATNVFCTSPDGATWTQRSLPVSKPWADIIWTGTQFIAVANDGTTIYSADGIVWTAGAPAVPAVQITQADVNAFNASLPTGAPYFYIVGSAGDPSVNPSGSASFTTSPFNVLVRGSLLELSAPPTSYCVRGSIREITAPPLPFASGGSLVERVSSITLPLTDLGAGGALQHLGTPFKTVGG